MAKTFWVLGVFVLWLPLVSAAAPKLLVLGDSLSAAYGIPLESGWVHLLQERIRSHDLPHTVINASVSGETARGGRERLPELLARHEPSLVLIELGGNDGLRGLAPGTLREHLSAMVRMVQQSDAQPVLFAMRIPSNYGPAYTERFRQSFETVAESHDVPLVPFLLTPIAEDRSAFLDDGIHPSAEAQPRILDFVWPYIEPLLHASKRAAVRN
ncbi:arylesterase [Algiphilus sp.]|uniref:arylesterase n=1 Tax=Algiphilus sp. TaxID=1872431 RepID=UPI003B52BDA2